MTNDSFAQSFAPVLVHVARSVSVTRAEVGGDVADVSPELALDDTRIPHGVEVFSARPPLENLITPAVILERHMERLVDVTHPMAEEFQRREPVRRRRISL
jgi:hypothetical protein